MRSSRKPQSRAFKCRSVSKKADLPVPIDIQVAGNNLDRLDEAVEQPTMMGSVEGIEDIEDLRALPSIEWQVDVDRKRAAQHGASVGCWAIRSKW